MDEKGRFPASPGKISFPQGSGFRVQAAMHQMAVHLQLASVAIRQQAQVVRQQRQPVHVSPQREEALSATQNAPAR